MLKEMLNKWVSSSLNDSIFQSLNPLFPHGVPFPSLGPWAHTWVVMSRLGCVTLEMAIHGFSHRQIQIQSQPNHSPATQPSSRSREISPLGTNSSWISVFTPRLIQVLIGLGFSFLCQIIPATTFALGVWQTQRLAWKTKLIQELADKSKAPPVDLPQT